jgi:ribosomal protein S18 acetylase RimI-like enzyme
MNKRLSVNCRPVQHADALTIHANCLPDRTAAEVKALVRNAQRLAAQRWGLGLVALHRAQIVGFGLLTLLPSAAEISELVVGAPWRGRGIGTMLVDHLARAAGDMGAGRLEIGVARANTRALSLYRRLGFANDREITLDLGNGDEPVVYLSKHLKSKETAKRGNNDEK